MERQFIEQAKGMYKADYTQEGMTFFLKDAGAPTNQIPNILDTAWTEFIAERTAKYKVLNKVIYYVAISLTVAILILFLIILPGRNIVVGNVVPFSILGAAFTCLFIFYIWVYRNTWKSPYVDTHGKPKIRYVFLLFFYLPGIILYYIFSGRLSMAQDTVLERSQIEAVGHILGGHSIGVRRVIGSGGISYSSLTVAFKTQKGDSVIVTKDVPTYKFKDFYKGQEIHLIYSKDNPRNIDLLADDNSIRNFKHTEQRALEMADLLRLATVNPQQLSAELNRISYGWTFDSTKNVYVNERFNNEVSANNRQLIFAGPQDDRVIFPDSLKAKGFKQIGKDDPDDLFLNGPRAFENAQFRVNLKVVFDHPGVDGDGHTLVIVIRK